MLQIRATKFHKSRLVPLSGDATDEMKEFLSVRQALPNGPDSPLLCNICRGTRAYTGPGIAQGMRKLFRTVQIQDASGRPPRVHDLRHTFAHQALLRWYRQGADLQSKLPALAAYMGHVSIFSTQHYLTALEPVAEKANERFARHCRPFLGTVIQDDGS